MKRFFGCFSMFVMDVFFAKGSRRVGIFSLALVLLLAAMPSQPAWAATPTPTVTPTATPTLPPTPPDTSIDAKPALISNDSTPVFAFSSPDATATFECALDGAGFAACASPKTYTALMDGSHTFQVRAKSSAGVDPTPASYTWIVDTIPPDATINTNPATPTNSTAASFGFSSMDATAIFQCKLDSAVFVACTSPTAYTHLSEGSHTFQVYATDLVGNISSPAIYTWTVDITPPDTVIGTSPTNPSNQPNPGFSFSGSEGASTFECKLDGGAFAVCVSPKSYTGLVDGAHTFQVRAKDLAGNIDPTPASYTWMIDTVAPDITIITKPANPTNVTTANFTFFSTDGTVTFECQLDGGAFVPCTSPKSYNTLPEGSHTFQVRARDPMGNASIASYAWTVDLTPPDIQITAYPINYDNSVNTSFSFFSSDATATFECALDGVAFAACANPKAYTALANGAHTFQVRAKDPAGNVGPIPVSYTWIIDTTLPDTNLYMTPSNPSGSSSPIFKFKIDGLITQPAFQCKLDASMFTSCASPQIYTGLVDGSHTFQVRAVNGSVILSSPASYTWTINTGQPFTIITTNPSDPSNNISPSFSFSISPGLTATSFECAMDGGIFTVCASPKTYTGLLDGSHTFQVYAIYKAGQNYLNALSVSYTWTVDTITPDVIISAKPANPTNDPNPIFTFSSMDSTATFECALDGAGFGACASPKPYAGLAEGSHTFQVRAKDPAGNISVASYAWAVDMTHPDVIIVTKPANPSSSATASFSFSSPDSTAAFECKLDVAAFAACASPITYTGLTNGSHTFQVRAKDPAGNVDPSPASYTWTITATLDTTINAKPANPTNSMTASFGFSSTDSAATFDCALDGAAFTTCASPKVYTALMDGTHTFQVRAKDSVGNVDPTPASYAWMIDTTAPDIIISTKPANPTKSTTATFTFSSSDSTATFECALDGALFVTCAIPMTYTNLLDGSHTFRVYARDLAGNDSLVDSYTWVIDTVAPDTTIGAKPANPSNSATASFSFSSPDVTAAFECALDGAAFATCTNPKVYTGLANGTHTFQVRAKDPAGNVDPTPASYTWVVNAITIVPDTIIDGQPSQISNDSSPTFAFSSLDGTATFECAMDGGPFDLCVSPTFYTGLSDGSHTFQVRAKNSSGNVDPTPASYTWTVDTIAPNVTIGDPKPSSLSNSTAASFSFSSLDLTATFECRLDGAAFGVCTSPMTYTSLTDGSHTFQVRAIDPAGNTSSLAGYTWVIDTTAPDTIIVTKPPLLSTSATANFSFSSPDVTVTFECMLDGAGFAACASPKAYTGLMDGSHTFQVRAKDLADNVDLTPASYTWTIQKERMINGGFNTYPGVGKIPTGWVKSATFTTLDGKDTLVKKEGTASVKIVGNGATKTLTQTLNIAGPSGAPFKFSFYVRGSALPAAGLCSAQVLLYKKVTDSAPGLTKTVSCPNGTYAAFTQKTISFPAPWAFGKVVIKFTFSKPSGTVWFDLVSLIE